MAERHEEFTLAAIQAAPVYLDRDASIDKACRLIEEAGALGVDLAVFGETWIAGYASFARNLSDDASLAACRAFILNAIEVPSAETDRLCAAAKRAGTDVVIGIAERDAQTRGTIYCTLLFIGRDGTILGKHRKLKPTFWERAVWGEGDGSSLVTYDRPYGRLGGLICWEHQMLLPGYALIAQGIEVLAGAWPGLDEDSSRQIALSRAYAIQSGAYVVMACNLCREEDVPEQYLDVVIPCDGGSAIIDPDGTILAGPMHGREGILTAKANLADVAFAKLIADNGGHYSRPDVFEFRVNTSPKRAAVFERREPPNCAPRARDEELHDDHSE